MDDKQLRQLVREEVEACFDDAGRIDSHPKFRRLVEARLGHRFADTDECWSETYRAWSDALTESGGPDDLADDVRDHYVDEAARLVEARSELTAEQVFDYIRYEADDRDSAVAFARAATDEVARRFGVANAVALRALQRAAKKGLVTKVGRIERGRGMGSGFQGRVTGAVGFQMWEVHYEPDEALPSQ